MTVAPTLDELPQTLLMPTALPTSPPPGRRTDPLLPGPALPLPRLPHTSPKRKRGLSNSATSRSSAGRLRAQLPAFAPLLEELEIAGWTSTKSPQRGNFHDWLLLGSDRLLVMVAHAAGPEPHEPTEPVLVAQAAWAAIRAHAFHTGDSGALLSLAGRSLWPLPAVAVHCSVAVAMIDTLEGHANLAIAGDCLAWKIRAATSEQLALHQPPLGAAADFTYSAHSVQLSLRERLVLVADSPDQRPPKLAASIAATFAHLDAETHRRMTAADAVTLLRRHHEQVGAAARAPASIAAVRRR